MPWHFAWAKPFGRFAVDLALFAIDGSPLPFDNEVPSGYINRCIADMARNEEELGPKSVFHALPFS